MEPERFDNLAGVIDMHIHSAPDAFQKRKHTDFQVAQTAQANGMAAVVLKSHTVPTADRAFLAGSLYPGVKVLGGVVLNLWVGGLNIRAVEAALDLGGKIVWLPTLHSQHEQRLYGNDWGIVCARDGKVVPELEAILRLLVGSGCALAMGHIAKEEQFIVAARARELGVEHIIVNHPALTRIGMSVEEQRELLRFGVYFERCFGGSKLPVSHEYVNAIDDNILAMRELGCESSIISSDLGQPANPDWQVGLSDYIRRVAAAGFSQEQIDLMTKKNPGKVLGLDLGA